LHARLTRVLHRNLTRLDRLRRRIALCFLSWRWVTPICKYYRQLAQYSVQFNTLPPLHRKGLLLCRYYWFGGTDRGEDLLIFASDYPHHEGTDNPIGRFEKTMKTTPKALKQKFYTENFKVLLDKN